MFVMLFVVLFFVFYCRYVSWLGVNLIGICKWGFNLSILIFVWICLIVVVVYVGVIDLLFVKLCLFEVSVNIVI